VNHVYPFAPAQIEELHGLARELREALCQSLRPEVPLHVNQQ
jgi:hypothetical protein